MLVSSDRLKPGRRRGIQFKNKAAVTVGISILFAGGLTQSAFATPIVHPGDRVSVKVYNHPELSSTLAVDSRGYITMPLAGSVSAAGLEPAKLAARLQSNLAPYVRFAAVEVQIAGEGSSIFVSGGPGGVLPYQPGETLAAAISQIKSDDGIDIMHSRVDLTQVRVTRDTASLGTFDQVALSGRGESGPVLAAGDTLVLVNKPIAVTVDGDVTRPGTTYLNRTQPLSDAILQLGGLTPTAATAQVAVNRSGAVQLHGLGDPIFQQPAREGDRMLVPTAPRVMIAGMVGTPGQVVLKNDFTLVSALYTAGGPNKWANLKNVQVVHQSQRTEYDITKLTHGDISQNPILKDGDVVFVPEGHKIDLSTFFSAINATRTIFPVRY